MSKHSDVVLLQIIVDRREINSVLARINEVIMAHGIGLIATDPKSGATVVPGAPDESGTKFFLYIAPDQVPRGVPLRLRVEVALAEKDD